MMLLGRKPAERLRANLIVNLRPTSKQKTPKVLRALVIVHCVVTKCNSRQECDRDQYRRYEKTEQIILESLPRGREQIPPNHLFRVHKKDQLFGSSVVFNISEKVSTHAALLVLGLEVP